MALFDLGDGDYVNTDRMTPGQKTTRTCPDCEEGTLTVQEQGEGRTRELYLECDNEDCGRAYYAER